MRPTGAGEMGCPAPLRSLRFAGELGLEVPPFPREHAL
jgi:hypothetical protein